jgi:replication factor C small subunit
MAKEFEIWAEKYRPSRVDDLIDQEHVKERVKIFLKEKNLPHMLFAGPPGTGKTTLALIIAKELYGEQWKANVLELNASVSKDTPILVKINGKIKRTNFEELDKIYFKENETYKDVNNLEVLTVDNNLKVKWGKVSKIIRHKVDKILRIKFEGGGELKLTGNHSVMVLDEDGLKPKSANELKEGDYIISFVCNLETDLSANKTVFKPKNSFYAFGLFTAEGCVGFKGDTSGQVIYTFGSHETNLINEIKNFAKDLGISVHERLIGSGFNREKLSAVHLRLLSTDLARFMKENFYDGKSFVASNKRVPSFVFHSAVKERINYLKGLADGDGCGEWNKVVRISSVSKDLLIDICWLARISGIEASVFKEEVRLIWRGPMKWKKSELLPAEIIIKLLKSIEKKIRGNWRYKLRHQLYEKKKRVSKKTLKEVLKMIDKKNLNKKERSIVEFLERLVFSDIHVLKIKKIEIIDYDGYVYDVSVPNNEMFFAGNIPILLHNSDERGIDVIRGKVKEFARTKAIGEVPFKLIIMDEADALTQEAQQALRRMMEDFAGVTRFILCCNYSSKIIEPIQSRCAVFRFKALPENAQREFIQRIVKGEGLQIDEEAIQAVLNIAEGDLRKIANLLQAAAAISKKITAEIVYDVASRAKPKEVEEMLNLALKGDAQSFQKARELLHKKLIVEGLAGEDLIKEIYRQVLKLNIPDEKKIELIEKIGEYEFRISEGGDALIQLTALLAQIALIGKKK